MAEIRADWGMINREIEGAAWGQAGAIVEKWANRFDCSTDKIYRECRKRFGKKKTIERETQVDPDNTLIEMVFNIKLMGEMMHLERREISTEACIDMLINRGEPGAENLTVSTVNRRLNEMGYREKQPNKRIESLYANQVHMIDFSRSKYFQLWEKDDNGDFMLTVSGKELHYKQDDTRLRTWIVQYMDDYSRLRKSRAYAETNESAFLGLDHLNYCWMPEEDDPHLMKYLPLEQLRSDNGAWRKSKETQTAMEEMGITLTKQMPGRKGGTAKVENRMKSLWRQFELPLAIQLGEGGRIRLSEYNELLHEFCVNEQEKQHPVYRNYTKGEYYQQSLADRSRVQRTSDVDVIRVACRVEKRTVDDHLRVSLNNEFYEVPQYINVQGSDVPTTGKEIYIHINKYGELTGKLIHSGATGKFELTEWEPSHWGKFESFKRTTKRLTEDRYEEDGISLGEITGAITDDTDSADVQDDNKKRVSFRYMEPVVERELAEASPFVDGDSNRLKQGRVFNSVLDARAFVGSQLETFDLSFSQVSHYFGDLMDETPIYEQELMAVVREVYEDFDSGGLRAVGT